MDQFTFSILDADGKESANDATYDITILSGYTTQGSEPRLADPCQARYIWHIYIATHAFEPYPGQTASEASG